MFIEPEGTAATAKKKLPKPDFIPEKETRASLRKKNSPDLQFEIAISLGDRHPGKKNWTMTNIPEKKNWPDLKIVC